MADVNALIRSWYASGIAAVEPRRAVRRHLGIDGNVLLAGSQRIPLPRRGIILISIGKAAVPMARGAEDVLLQHIGMGILITKDGHAENTPAGMRVFEAAHPVPDERGITATSAVLDVVDGLERDDVVVALISGGGSALFEAPRDPLTLEDLQATTGLLLRAGAPIQHLNAVRGPLSLVKGGGLRDRIGAAKCVSLILSDVLGNDPTVIASGPTVQTASDPALALALLGRYDVLEKAPPGVIQLLDRLRDDPDSGAGTEIASDDVFEIIADNDVFVEGVEAAAAADGFVPSIERRGWEGEARELGRAFVTGLADIPADVQVILGGGEATVTVNGDGIGGRNTEFALAAAIEIDRTGADWTIASLASDGQDGLVDAAGAIVDKTTIGRAMRQGLDAIVSLDRNDSGTFFARLGDLVAPGRTGTNVNDVYIAVRTDSGP